MGPHPAVSQLRSAVRECLADLEPGELVLAACSGGADSLALAASLAFVAPRQGLRAGGVTVDHRLQSGSARQAARVAAQLTGLGLEPVQVAAVTVGRRGGPEAAARSARYRALDERGQAAGAAAVLLGHTLDDQAETVLLGLARGSGSRSLAGMPGRAGMYRRPFLAIGRDQTRAACGALGLEVWEDPHNADSGYARARVRHHVLPTLEAALGPGIAEALARTAGQLRDDADALDELARQQAQRLAGPDPAMSVDALAAAARRGAHPGAQGGGHHGRLSARGAHRTRTWPGWTSWSPAGAGSAGQTCPAAYGGCASVGSCGSLPAAGPRTCRPAPGTAPAPSTAPAPAQRRHPGRYRYPGQEGRGWTRATWDPT